MTNLILKRRREDIFLNFPHKNSPRYKSHTDIIKSDLTSISVEEKMPAEQNLRQLDWNLYNDLVCNHPSSGAGAPQLYEGSCNLSCITAITCITLRQYGT